jgi:hypothetical protein
VGKVNGFPLIAEGREFSSVHTVLTPEAGTPRNAL